MTAGDLRHWLVACLQDRPDPDFPRLPSGAESAQVLALAVGEGVAGLVHARLVNAADGSALAAMFADAARRQAARALWVRAETGRLLDAFAAQGLRVLVLKGSALVWWLYSAPQLRASGDLDLLFASRQDALRALDILTDCGYADGHDQGDHAYEMLRKPAPGARYALEVDVHWRLLNAPVFAQALDFQALWAASITIPALGAQARGLGPVHALLHAAMNRAVNLYTGTGEVLKCLYDIHLLVAWLDDAAWAETVRLAIATGLCGVLHSALEAVRSELRTDVPAWVLAELARAIPMESLDPQRLGDWGYMQRRNAAALPLRQRLYWLWRRLLPDLGYLRSRHGADASVPRLLLDQVRRLLVRLFPRKPE